MSNNNTHNKQSSVAIASLIGMISLGVYVCKAPDQLERAIPESALAASLVFNMIKNDRPNQDPTDHDPPDHDPPDDEGKPQ